MSVGLIVAFVLTPFLVSIWLGHWFAWGHYDDWKNHTDRSLRALLYSLVLMK